MENIDITDVDLNDLIKKDKSVQFNNRRKPRLWNATKQIKKEPL